MIGNLGVNIDTIVQEMKLVILERNENFRGVKKKQHLLLDPARVK